MRVYTSYYGNIKKIKNDGKLPVRISKGKPKYIPFINGIDELYPSWKLVKINDFDKYKEEYLKEINLKNAILKIKKLQNEYNKDIVLLCYEKPREYFCHRHIVANLLEEQGIECFEYGFDKNKFTNKNGFIEEIQDNEKKIIQNNLF